MSTINRALDSSASGLDRLLARLPPQVEKRVRERLGLDLFIVCATVLVFLRFANVFPWNASVLDMHTYWETTNGIRYEDSNPYAIGAYLYAPAFAHVIAPLTELPWPWFAAVWTALIAAAYIWLVGRWAFPLLFSVAVALELYLGQIDVFIAAAIVIGFRYPAVWAFPLLTKVAPGVGLVWFVVRREWRNLAIALTATVAVAAVSALAVPELWRGWYDLLRRSLTDRQTVEGAYLAIPLILRLPIGVALIAWGARTNRHWTVPVGVLLSMPILWANVFTLLLAVIPLRPEWGPTPAQAWLVKARLLPRGFLRRRSSAAPQIG